MSALAIKHFVQVPLVIEAFQFTGGADNAKSILDLIMPIGGEADWRPEWVSFERGKIITNPESLVILRHTTLTVGDWVILKPNPLKPQGFEVKILDDVRFRDQYIMENSPMEDVIHSENTMEIVLNTLGRLIDNQQHAENIVKTLQDRGIRFREVA
jgi:hypothetical protein